MKHIPDEVLDQLLEDCDKPEDILGANGLLASLQKSILERILEAELTDHLGYCKHEAAGRGSGNSRNGLQARADRQGLAAARGAPRPQRQLRAAVRGQAPDPPARLRRGGHLAVCPRADPAGTFGPTDKHVSRHMFVVMCPSAICGPRARK